MALSDVKIRSSKPSKKQLKLFDGDGLFLIGYATGREIF